ncbi:MAG TPA: hypothetical protein VHC49_17075 [Mycobacteriales bacterium]|nr:hypothetical protein [Mycobacteriales bacterium]
MRIARSGAVLALAAILALAACTHEQKPPPPTPTPTQMPLGSGNPLGSKWDWGMSAPLAVARQMRGGATFFEVERCDVEPRPGQYDWKRVDRVVQDATAMGYSMMLKIRAGDCYGDAGDGSGVRDKTEATAKTPSSLPTDLNAYRDFVTMLVARYSAKGVHEYAVENEIDTANFWSGDYADFTTLAKAAAQAIHTADPKAKVLDPGLSSTAYGAVLADAMVRSGDTDRALSFYQAYYQRRQDGGASRFPKATDSRRLQHILAQPMAQRAIEAADEITRLDKEHVFDVYQLHFYEPVAALPQVLTWIHQHVSLPVEAWEVGVAWPGEFDPQVQAEDTAKLTGLLLGAGVRRVVYLPLAPTPKDGKQPVFRGLADPDGTITPAGRVFEKLAGLLSGGVTVRTASLSGLTGISISGKKGTDFLLWTAGGDQVSLRSGISAQSVTGSGAGSSVGSDPVLVHRDQPLSQAQNSLIAR